MLTFIFECIYLKIFLCIIEELFIICDEILLSQFNVPGERYVAAGTKLGGGLKRGDGKRGLGTTGDGWITGAASWTGTAGWITGAQPKGAGCMNAGIGGAATGRSCLAGAVAKYLPGCVHKFGTILKFRLANFFKYTRN